MASQQLPHANWKWEDVKEKDRTWVKWKELYKSEESKEKVRALATGGQGQFGAANCTAGLCTS